MGKHKINKRQQHQSSSASEHSTGPATGGSLDRKSGFVESVFGIPKIRADIAVIGKTVTAFGSRIDELRMLDARIAEISGKIDKLTGAEACMAKLEARAKEVSDAKENAQEETRRERSAFEAERKNWADREKALLAQVEDLQSQMDERLVDKPSAYLPAGSVELIGLKHADLDTGAGRSHFAALRAWCDFMDWSDDGDAAGFVKQFRRVDGAVEHLDEREAIRGRIAAAVRCTVSRNLRAAFEVSWDFVGQSYDEDRHFASEGGTEIVAVSGALITRDGSVLDKARVVCA